MNRIPIIAGNWKMNTTVDDAVALVDAIREALGECPDVQVAVCPPYISLMAVAERLRGSRIQVGAQNMHAEEKGAFTGEVSAPMLRPLCTYVILGHSERRQHFGETDGGVNRKVGVALRHGLRPIVCVGETLLENESGTTVEVVERQVRGALEGIEPTPDLVIAYEPVWAIGTGRAATADQAAATIGDIRRIVGGLWGSASAAGLRIQYGGSVTTANAAELFRREEIDGALVGGASLKAADFAAIVRAAIEARL